MPSGVGRFFGARGDRVEARLWESLFAFAERFDVATVGVAACKRSRDAGVGVRRKRRPCECEWPEESVREDLLNRLAVQLLGDQAEENGIGVGVVITGVGREIRRLAQPHCQQFLGCPHSLRLLVERLVEFEGFGVVVQAATHVE